MMGTLKVTHLHKAARQQHTLHSMTTMRTTMTTRTGMTAIALILLLAIGGAAADRRLAR